MRILITGAGGFVGSHLMDAWPGWSVVWLRQLSHWAQGELSSASIELDICWMRERSLRTGMNELEPEVVIHCAASYSDPDKWHRDTDTNVSGCINAAAVAKHHGAHLLYFQTILPPVSSYAISKLAGEQYLRLSGVPLTVFRMANIYGPRNISGPIPVFYKRMTEGQGCLVVDTTRDMLYIDDLVRLVKTCVTQQITGTYDVCSGVQTPIMDLFRAVANEVGYRKEPPLIPPDPDDVQGKISITKALPSWKWEPMVPLEEGIRRTVASYRETPVTDTYTHLRIGTDAA